MGRFNRWDTPWFNPKLLTGVAVIAAILLLGLLGRFFWDTNLAYTGSSPLNLPPVGPRRVRRAEHSESDEDEAPGESAN